MSMVWVLVDAAAAVFLFFLIVSFASLVGTLPLMRLGIIDPQNGGVCMFCGVMPESVDHLLVLFPLVWRIWCECECELVGFDMGYPKFNKAIVTVVAELEIQEGKEMAKGGLSNGHIMVPFGITETSGCSRTQFQTGNFFCN